MKFVEPSLVNPVWCLYMLHLKRCSLITSANVIASLLGVPHTPSSYLISEAPVWMALKCGERFTCCRGRSDCEVRPQAMDHAYMISAIVLR